MYQFLRGFTRYELLSMGSDSGKCVPSTSLYLYLYRSSITATTGEPRSELMLLYSCRCNSNCHPQYKSQIYAPIAIGAWTSTKWNSACPCPLMHRIRIPDPTVFPALYKLQYSAGEVIPRCLLFLRTNTPSAWAALPRILRLKQLLARSNSMNGSATLG
jgi:hypothetical protein